MDAASLSRIPSRVGDLVAAGVAVARTGVVRPVRPDRLAGMGLAALRNGPTVATAIAVGAARHPDRVALIDERGPMSYAATDTAADALAAGLAGAGLAPGDKVGVLLRNSRYMLLTLAALAKLGADALLLNTGFAAPQATEVMKRHEASAVIHDDEFLDIVDEAATGRIRVVGWTEKPVGEGAMSIDDLLRTHVGQQVRRPRWNSRLIILTSGTTGTPKGASRGGMHMVGGVNLFTAMPVRSGDVTVVACPIFHSWGLGNTAIALGLGNPIVLRRRFDPEQTLADIARYRARVLAVVPVMMQRMADLPEEVRLRYDVSSLGVVGASGSALPGDLATRFMDAFGDVIYNLYGSTEVGYVTVAGPTDLRAAPGTAGHTVRGNEIELLADDDQPVSQGQVGRIFIRGPLLFEGYTGGGDKARVRGMMSTGDVGHIDENGRLFVTGRDDEMIVSGGENVFPAEVENLLASQPEIAEAAVIGVDDEKFGQRLAAYVVLRDGQSLDRKAVQDRVKRDLAGYKVPRDVHFLDALPRNDTGKVVKSQLGQD
ncbi:MAG TPA: AMP-binding protein [Frankiaceae bacterium]|nr:AMP-binding protein [Frankiaceae bacterium]